MPIQPANIRFDSQGNAFSEAFDDIYFNPNHAAGKTAHIFHRATQFNEQLADLSDGQPLILGELGFGLGLNFLGTWEAFKQNAPPNSPLHYVGIDLAPPSHDQLRQALHRFAHWQPEAQQLLGQWPGRVAGVHRISLDRCELTLHFGDAREMLTGVTGSMHAWFLDGFAPEKNPDMWSPAIAEQLFRLTRPGGRLGSFTAAGHVRRALSEAGFEVERLPGDPFKRHIISAQKPFHKKTSLLDCPQKRRVVVVGAGWAGLRLAEVLHRRGHGVTVVDSGVTKGGGTAGLRPPLNMGAAAEAFPSGALSGEALAGEIFSRGASGNLQAVGAPVLDAAASWRQDFYRSAFVLASRKQTRCGVLRRPDLQKNGAALRQAAEVFGSLDEHLTWREDLAGLWMPTAGWARFADLVEKMQQQLPAQSLRRAFEVDGFHRLGDGWRLRSAQGQTIDADTVVLACASAVRRFAPTRDWPLRTIRGQVSHVRSTPSSAALDHVVVGEAYLCPAHDGVHSVGATFGPDDLDPAQRAGDHDDNRRRAMLTDPHWAEAMDWSSVQGRVGFRCNSPDYLPMIGPVPDMIRCQEITPASLHSGGLDAVPVVPNLFAITALGSHGVITSALAAPLIADLIDRAPLPCSSQAYAAVHPGRYLVRAVKRRQAVAYPSVD